MREFPAASRPHLDEDKRAAFIGHDEIDHDGLIVAKAEPGVCRVICYSPRHDLTMARLSVDDCAASPSRAAAPSHRFRWRPRRKFFNLAV